MLACLADYRAATDDRVHLLRRVRGHGDPYRIVPYRTRFNSVGRALTARDRLRDGFDVAAASGYQRGLVVTLTTDPKRYADLGEATASLGDDLGRFRSWLAYRLRDADGSRWTPPSVAVREFSSKGVPHVHLVLFGVGATDLPTAAVREYWDETRGRGEQVFTDEVRRRGSTSGGSWVWARPRQGRRRSPLAYLSKGVRDLAAFAGASTGEVRAAAERLRAGDAGEDDVARSWWTLACHYATESRLVTVSDRLRPTDGSDDSRLPHVPCYEYVGTASLGALPGYIREQTGIWSGSFSDLQPQPPPGTEEIPG
ncbi:hypothetical protein DEQ92_04150 [Haloferax sp. Atlit-6N]|nr:hypothetical protein DEQ92_04150 [Haloferax sp. Atlit-6N]